MTELRTRVTGRQVDVGEALRSKIEEELQTGIAKYASSRDGEAVVTIGREAHMFTCEIILHLDSKMTLEANGEGAEAPIAFADALEKIEKRVRREKRKLKDHHPSGAAIDTYPE